MEIKEELSPAEQEQYCESPSKPHPHSNWPHPCTMAPTAHPKRRIQWKGKSPPPRRVSPWSAAEGGVAGGGGAGGGGAELWARLDDLEREEEVFLREEEEERAVRGGWEGAGIGVAAKTAGVAMRLPPEQPSSGELSGGAEGRRDGSPAPARITFTHSHDAAGREEEEEEEERRKVMEEGERKRGDRKLLQQCVCISPSFSPKQACLLPSFSVPLTSPLKLHPPCPAHLLPPSL